MFLYLSFYPFHTSTGLPVESRGGIPTSDLPTALASLSRRLLELTELQTAVSSARLSLQLMDALHPLRVLGFEASLGLLTTFFPVSVSAVSTLAGIYVSASGGSGSGSGGGGSSGRAN